MVHPGGEVFKDASVAGLIEEEMLGTQKLEYVAGACTPWDNVFWLGKEGD